MAQAVTLLSDNNVGQILQSTRDNFSGQVERSRIQSIINFAKESALARQIIGRDTRLQQCTPESIQNTFMNVAFTGLSLNPVKQHATFLARWNDRIKGYECTLSIMYRGLMWLAGQAGVTDISVDVVYTADKISITKSDEGDKFEHQISIGVPRDEISSKFLGVYVAAKMPGSTNRKVEWIPCEDIYRARAKSDSYVDNKGNIRESSPWVQWFDEQAKKVGIKRAQKRWEEAVVENDDWKRFQTAVALDNQIEGVIPAKESDIPGTAAHVAAGNDKPPAEIVKLSMAQLTEIEKLVQQVAPNREDAPNNVSHYMSKIARTYRQNVLSEVDASKFDEIKTRISNAIKAAKEKAAANKKGPETNAAGEGSQGKGDAGKQQDPAAKGATKAGTRGEGKAGADQKGKEAAGGKVLRGGDREPGSDDDAGGDGSGPGNREPGDPGPSGPNQS